MNKPHKILIFLSLAALISNCNSSKRSLTINQKRTDKTIVIKSSLENKIIYSFKIPNRLEIKNNAFLSKSFITINYLYKDSLSNWANRNIELYRINNEKLKRISNNKKKTIPSKGSIDFIYYTRHFIDSSTTTQKQFKSYTEMMLAENKDTLHIGTVTEFKQKHRELFEKLTKGDSISIHFLNNGKLGEKITVPVEW